MSNVTVSAVEEFKQAWFSGMESLLKACQIYVKAIDDDPSTKERFKSELPKINAAAWGMIEKTGRGQMHYTLLCDGSPAASHIRKLPYSEQQRAIDVGFEVLTDSGDILKVKHENLTENMINQVISRDHIRDIAGQKAYLESKKLEKKIESSIVKHDVKINKDSSGVYHIEFPKGWKGTQSEILKLLQDMC